MKTVERFLFVSLLFLLPTQLAYHFWPSWAFVFGLRIDLLSPAIYLTDILVVILILLNFKIIKPLFGYSVVFVGFALLNTLFSTSPPESLYRWLKVLEFFLLSSYIAKQKIIKKDEIIKCLFYSLVSFSVIGIVQFIKGGTIGELLYWLGERNFNTTTPGIALVALNGVEYLRAYSTFAHPNSLAGYLGAALLFVLLSGLLKKTISNFFGVTLILVCFVLSFSLSSILGIFFVFAFYLFSKNTQGFNRLVLITFFTSILISLILPLFSPSFVKFYPNVGQSVSQRLDLALISGKMISNRFLLGQGLGTFITNIPLYKGIESVSWLLQPVHNIFLLVFVETGLIGLLLACLSLYKLFRRLLTKKNYSFLLPFLFIIFTGLFDHYSLTLQQNQLLLSLLIGLSFI